MSNRQKVFDKALAHLRKQGKRSMSFAGCAYRGPDGLKCAIGIFIADRKYNAVMEGNTADTDCVFGALPKYVADAGEKFLSDIQNELHDGVYDSKFLKGLEIAAESLASDYSLKYTAP